MAADNHINVASLQLQEAGEERGSGGFVCVYLSASSIGSKLRSAVSLGSLNQDLMGIALSGRQNTNKHTKHHRHTKKLFNVLY